MDLTRKSDGCFLGARASSEMELEERKFREKAQKEENWEDPAEFDPFIFIFVTKIHSLFLAPIKSLRTKLCGKGKRVLNLWAEEDMADFQVSSSTALLDGGVGELIQWGAMKRGVLL